MDWLTFISTMTGHIMWPLVIIVLLILLRKHVGVLADRIEEFSFGGAKFTWKKKLQEGARIIERAPVPTLPKPAEPELPLNVPMEKPRAEIDISDPPLTLNYLRNRRQRRRQAALARVISGLDEIDKLAFEIGDWHGVDAASPISVIHMLAAIDLIPESVAKLYRTLSDGRSALEYSGLLPNDVDAAEYERQIAYLKTFLEGLRDAAIDARRDADNDKDGKKE